MREAPPIATRLPDFDFLASLAARRSTPVPVVVAGAEDETVLASMAIAASRGWVRPIVVGDETEIRRIGKTSGLDGFQVVHAGQTEVADLAVAEIRQRRAQILIKGRIATPALMAAVMDPESGLRSGRVVSQIVLMTVKDRRFLMADTGISIKPKLATKAEIVRQVVEVARSMGLETPRVALMAASETVTASMPETIDAAELSRMDFGGAIVEGPLSFDLAYSTDAGGRKRIEGEVVGRADAMVFPDLLSANLTVKAIMYTSDCRFGGILKGTTAPVAFMSRADDVETRLNSLAFALAMLGDDEAPGETL